MKNTKELAKILLDGIEFIDDPFNEGGKMIPDDTLLDKFGENAAEVFFYLLQELVDLINNQNRKAESALNEIINKCKAVINRANKQINAEFVSEDLFIGNYCAFNILADKDQTDCIERCRNICGDKFDDINGVFLAHPTYQELALKLKEDIEVYERQQKAIDNLVPYTVKQFDELIGKPKADLIRETFNICMAISNYSEAGLPLEYFRPLAERGRFLMLVSLMNDGLTQELVEEFEKDSMSCINRLEMLYHKL